MKLSIIIPCFNEVSTIEDIIVKINIQKDYNKEIIIVDDGSTDGTLEILKNKLFKHVDHIIYNERNYGKGYSIRKGIQFASGDVLIIQDADLEYDPSDYFKLIEPIRAGYADVVYGSRLTRAKATSIVGFPNYIGNILLTFLMNLLFNKIFTDIATGYKVFKKDVIKNMEIISDGFEIEPEITAKISLNKGLRIFEVPITINSRGVKEGKKVKWWHFFTYIFSIIKWRFKD